jgi:hypothetical protein
LLWSLGGQQARERGYEEGGGLAGARLSLAGDVYTVEGQGKGLGLYRGAIGETGFVDSSAHRLGQFYLAELNLNAPGKGGTFVSYRLRLRA